MKRGFSATARTGAGARTIVVVGNDREAVEAWERDLGRDDEVEVEVVLVPASEAMTTLAERPADLLVCAPGEDNGGTKLVGELARVFPEIRCLFLSGGSASSDTTAAARLGPNVTVLDTGLLDEGTLQAAREALDPRQTVSEEQALVRHAGVTEAQIARASRIRDRMQTSQSLGDVLIGLGELTQEAYDRANSIRRSELSLAEVLEEDGKLSAEDRAAYERDKRRSPGRSDRELLVDANRVTEEQYLQALCSKLHIPFADPDIGKVNLNIFKRTSAKWLLRNAALPVRPVDGKLEVVVADPSNRRLLTELKQIFGMEIAPTCSTQEKIVETLNTLQRIDAGRSGAGAVDLSLQYRSIETEEDDGEIGEEAVQVVDYLFTRAIELGASDLHIEPMRTKVRVRVRVDGTLHHLTDLPVDLTPRIVSRVKILANADITEKRMHQDGKICVRYDNREIDIRMSSYVSTFGETIVVRLLDRERGILPLDQVGFTERALSALTEVALRSSSGLVLVVGPTGSGKTTTLYSFIEHANDESRKVITCEDPVEYVMDGVVQCSVNSKTGPTFPDSLRAIVRQDPDTIVVGEIRDKVTAGLALESALTGHKVYSTFHTEEAVTAFVRLLEMGVEPYLVSSTVSAVVAQRLVRRVCSKCSKPGAPSRPEARFLSLDRSRLREVEFLVAGECTECKGTGYSGRTAIHEVLIPNDAFRAAVLRRAAAGELREHARRLPEFLTMQEDGLLKAVNGETTLAEVIANAPRDSTPRDLATIKTIAMTRRI